MEPMNFPPIFISWIFACLSSPTFACLINGIPFDWFSRHRGIRQGDQISPYLYILVQQILSLILTDLVSFNKFTPFNIKGIKVSHLMFANDLIFSFRANLKTCNGVLSTLNLFANLTNLTVSLDKSNVYFPKRCSLTTKYGICNLFDIKEGSRPIPYLETFLSDGRIQERHQGRMVDKALGKIKDWYNGLLSQMSKTVLINSVINSIPTHTLMSSWTNKKIISNMSKVTRNFFWNDNADHNKCKLINWDQIANSKSCSGLGIHNLKIIKTTINAKCVLPLLNCDSKLWVNIHRAKYGDLNPWENNKTTRVSHARQGLSHLLNHLMGWVLHKIIGEGCKVWTNPWIYNCPIN